MKNVQTFYGRHTALSKLQLSHLKMVKIVLENHFYLNPLERNMLKTNSAGENLVIFFFLFVTKNWI